MTRRTSPGRSGTVSWPWPDAAAQKQATAAFDFQMWLWGRDVLGPRGNLLAEYGLARDGTPDPKRGCTCYRQESLTWSIVLWGWGLYWGRGGDGGLLLMRSGFQLLFRHSTKPPRDVWSVAALPQFRDPSAADFAAAGRLLDEALDWVARYECWVIGQYGAGYRKSTAAEWTRKTPVAADQLADFWQGLRDDLAINLAGRAMCAM